MHYEPIVVNEGNPSHTVSMYNLIRPFKHYLKIAALYKQQSHNSRTLLV
jgi:hypothetical protein